MIHRSRSSPHRKEAWRRSWVSGGGAEKGKKEGEAAKKAAPKKKNGGAAKDAGGALDSVKKQMTKAGQAIGVVEKKKTMSDEM